MTDILLEWMSFRESGRKRDLPEDLFPSRLPKWIFRDLSVLGHIEESNGIWRIAPPVLAVTESDKADACQGILCGARTPKLLERLKTASKRIGTKYHEIPQEDRPSIITIEGANSIDIAATAIEAGLPVQHDAPFTLLACLPTIRNWPRKNCTMVTGKVLEVKRFSRSKLIWQQSSLKQATQAHRGFFRIHRRDWDWVNILKLGPESQAEIEYRAGLLAVTQKAKIVRWSAESRCLHIPRILYPPTLIARALVLCSGKLPGLDQDRGETFFHHVPVRITKMARAIMGLRFK